MASAAEAAACTSMRWAISACSASTMAWNSSSSACWSRKKLPWLSISSDSPSPPERRPLELFFFFSFFFFPLFARLAGLALEERVGDRVAGGSRIPLATFVTETARGESGAVSPPVGDGVGEVTMLMLLIVVFAGSSIPDSDPVSVPPGATLCVHDTRRDLSLPPDAAGPGWRGGLGLLFGAGGALGGPVPVSD